FREFCLQGRLPFLLRHRMVAENEQYNWKKDIIVLLSGRFSERLCVVRQFCPGESEAGSGPARKTNGPGHRQCRLCIGTSSKSHQRCPCHGKGARRSLLRGYPEGKPGSETNEARDSSFRGEAPEGGRRPFLLRRTWDSGERA